MDDQPDQPEQPVQPRGRPRKPHLTPGAFAPRLIAAREAAGLTVPHLAELSGVSQSGIYELEAGRQQPQLAILRRLATALGCTLDALAG